MSPLFKILSVITVVFCCVGMFFLGGFSLHEGYNPVKPDIDTQFGPGYSEENFNKITEGIDSSEVIKLIGRPIGVIGSSSKLWYYSTDGKCKWQNFAWLARAVVIDRNGKVKQVQKSVRYD